MSEEKHLTAGRALMFGVLFTSCATGAAEQEPAPVEAPVAEEIVEQEVGPGTGLSRGPESFLSRLHRVGPGMLTVFGGLNSPAGQIEETDRINDPAFRFPAIYDAAEPWRAWKKRQLEENGLQLSGHYTTLFQRISDKAPGAKDEKASSGVFRLTAAWTLIGDSQNPDEDYGALNVMLDHRHKYRDVVPADLAGQAGYTGVTGTLYTDTDLVVTNLNWTQSFGGRQGGLLMGRYDPND